LIYLACGAAFFARGFTRGRVMTTNQIAGIPVNDEQFVRLECVRLVHRPDKDEQTIIDRADKLASYVINGTGKPSPQGEKKARQGKGKAPS